MTAFAFRVQRLPMTILMALGAGEFPVILVQRESGHAVVIEAQLDTFPPIHAVALQTLGAENSLVRFVVQMAGLALVGGLTRRLAWADFRAVVARAALRRQVSALEVLAGDLAVEDVFHAGILLGPGGGGMARRAAGAVIRGMPDLVTRLAAGRQLPKLRGSERGPKCLRLVALNAIHGCVLSGQRKLGVATVINPTPGR